MNLDMAMQLVRYVLLSIGPILVSRGFTTDDQWQLIIGATVSVLTALWGVYVNWGSTKVPDAHAVRADVPTVSPITGSVKEGPGL